MEAAKATWWCTELAKNVVEACVQLRDGCGYLNEYRVAGDYVDSSIMIIFGGTTEIAKDRVGRDPRSVNSISSCQPHDKEIEWATTPTATSGR